MAGAVHTGPEAEGDPATGARWALGLSTAVLWFLLAGLSTALTAASSATWGIAARADTEFTHLLIGLLSLLVLAAPALPLGAVWGRERLATRSALLAFGAGVVHASVGGHVGVVAALIAFSGAASFLVATVGLAHRRAIAGGMVGAFLLREVIALAGLRGVGMPTPGAIAVAAAIAALGLACLHRWRASPQSDRGESFERRAGGLRLRGALALGAILFLELSWGLGVRADATPLSAAASLVPAALVWLLVVRGFDAQRHRLLAVALAVVVTASALLGRGLGPLAPAAALALPLGHAAALLLLDRALAPVSGRRSGGNLAFGLLLCAVLSLGLATVWGMAAPDAPADVAQYAWPLLGGVILIVAMHLTPRPAHAPPAVGDRVAVPIAVALPVLGAIVAAL